MIVWYGLTSNNGVLIFTIRLLQLSSFLRTRFYPISHFWLDVTALLATIKYRHRHLLHLQLLKHSRTYQKYNTNGKVFPVMKTTTTIAKHNFKTRKRKKPLYSYLWFQIAYECYAYCWNAVHVVISHKCTCISVVTT